MADLTGQTPQSTYEQLIHLENGTVDGTNKVIQDGRGNATALELSTGRVGSTGTIESAGNMSSGGNMFVGTAATADVGPVVIRDGNGELQVLDIDASITIDTGWQNFPNSATSLSFGLLDPSYTNNPSPPQYRFLDRFVIFRGSITIPLQISVGSYQTDLNLTKTTNSNTATSFLGTTSYSYDAEGESLQSIPSFSNPLLFPDSNIDFGNKLFTRQVQTSTELNPIPMQFISPRVRFTSTGRLQIYSVRTLEKGVAPLNTVSTPASLLRQICTRANTGEEYLSGANYRTSSDGTNFFNVWAHGGLAYPLTLDTTDPNDWGGFSFDLAGMYYTVSSSTTLSQLRAALA